MRFISNNPHIQNKVINCARSSKIKFASNISVMVNNLASTDLEQFLRRTRLLVYQSKALNVPTVT